jgi:hypothetical protein
MLITMTAESTVDDGFFTNKCSLPVNGRHFPVIDIDYRSPGNADHSPVLKLPTSGHYGNGRKSSF